MYIAIFSASFAENMAHFLRKGNDNLRESSGGYCSNLRKSEYGFVPARSGQTSVTAGSMTVPKTMRSARHRCTLCDKKPRKNWYLLVSFEGGPLLRIYLSYLPLLSLEPVLHVVDPR